jgi:hypothetical protein
MQHGSTLRIIQFFQKITQGLEALKVGVKLAIIALLLKSSFQYL